MIHNRELPPIIKIGVGGPRMVGKTALIQKLIILLKNAGADVEYSQAEQHKLNEPRPVDTLRGRKVIIYEIHHPARHADVIDGIDAKTDSALENTPEPFEAVKDGKGAWRSRESIAAEERSRTKAPEKSTQAEPEHVRVSASTPKPRLNAAPTGTRTTLFPDTSQAESGGRVRLTVRNRLTVRK